MDIFIWLWYNKSTKQKGGAFMSRKPKINKRADGNYYFNYCGKKYVRAKKSDLEVLMTEILNRPDLYKSMPPSELIKQTIKQGMEVWLKKRKDRIEITTYDTIYKSANNYIYPTVGDIQIGSLEVGDVEKMIHYMRVERQLSYNTTVKALSILKMFYKETNAIEQIKQNPFKNISVKKDNNAGIKFYTEAELDKICKASNESKIRLAKMFIVLANTGMRIGEMLALTTNDIDFENKTIHITKSIAKTENNTSGNKTQLIQKPPKNQSSNRFVPINKACEDALRHIIKETEPVRQAHNVDYIFVSRRGNFIENKYVNSVFKKILCSAGMDKVIFDGEPKLYGVHSLRHSFATILINNKNANIVKVSKILGHSNIKTTTGVYVHVLPKDLQEIVDLI